MRLVDALVELAVPEPSDVEALVAFGDDLYAKVDASDLDDSDAVAAAVREHAPEFVALAEAASRAEDQRAEQLLEAVAMALPGLRSLVFLDAADVVLSCPNLLATQSRPLAAALAERVESTRSDDGLQAYSYLEVLTRLGLLADAGRFRALEVLSSVTLNDSAEFLERLPKLVGLAFDQWRDAALNSLLKRLLEHQPAQADALFELGQVTLRTALEGSSLEAVLTGLFQAREQFAMIESMEEARDDATVYRCALDAMVAFAGSASGTATDTAESIDELTAAAARRAAFSTRSAMGGWAEPRRQAESEWYALANTLRAAAGPLGQASWLTPVETLSRVLAAYQASRSVTVTSVDGLRVVLEPTVEATFIRREGLLAHLRDSLDADEVPATDVDAARALLEAVSSTKGPGGGDALGKVWAAAPALVAELGADADPAVAVQLAQAVDETPEVVAWMNEQAEARARAKARRADPVVDGLLAYVLDRLKECEDLVGTIREEFVEVFTEVLRFTADRADIGRGSGGVAVAYLFPPEAGENPFTEDNLQRDVFSWLESSGLRPYARMEERDIAAGRADVTVTRDYRFVIEVKRELSDASREALLAAYGGQAAAYSAAGPRLSLAMVLDLTDHSQGWASLKESVWVDEVPVTGGEPRHVVTVVVRGNRNVPRRTRTAEAD